MHSDPSVPGVYCCFSNCHPVSILFPFQSILCMQQSDPSKIQTQLRHSPAHPDPPWLGTLGSGAHLSPDPIPEQWHLVCVCVILQAIDCELCCPSWHREHVEGLWPAELVLNKDTHRIERVYASRLVHVLSPGHCELNSTRGLLGYHLGFSGHRTWNLYLNIPQYHRLSLLLLQTHILWTHDRKGGCNNCIIVNFIGLRNTYVWVEGVYSHVRMCVEARGKLQL